MPVKDVMSSEQVLYCFDDETPAQVAANMANSLVRRLPVLNRDKRLVGIVSIGDLSARGSASTAGKALGDIARSQ